MEILVISGLSGAGKSKAASFLEDMGFYIVDNMPAAMILKFAEFCIACNGRYDRVALVYDVRTASSFDELFQVLDTLNQKVEKCQLLFLDAAPEVIIKRYKESRRRHPLSDHTELLEDAVREEQRLMKPVMERADLVIDTSHTGTAQLRAKLLRYFGSGSQEDSLSVVVTSFGFKHGLPLEADLVFDVRFMPNPFYVEELKNQTGLDAPVSEYIFGFQVARDYLQKLEDLMDFSLPLYAEEGKTSLVIAVGCTGGQHRSVAIAHALAQNFREKGYHVTENHRDMKRG